LRRIYASDIVKGGKGDEEGRKIRAYKEGGGRDRSKREGRGQVRPKI